MPDTNKTDYDDQLPTLEQHIFTRQHRTSSEPVTPWVFSKDKPRRGEALRNLPQKIKHYFS